MFFTEFLRILIIRDSVYRTEQDRTAQDMTGDRTGRCRTEDSTGDRTETRGQRTEDRTGQDRTGDK